VKVPEPVKAIVDKSEGVGEPLDVKVVEETRSDSEKLVMGTASDPGGAAGEKAPFAPASNIELVVLPRRDKVQLTIYNSADLTLVREERNLTMKKGWNWLQFEWANTKIRSIRRVCLWSRRRSGIRSGWSSWCFHRD